MLIHRRPSASTISTRGASGSGAATMLCPRTRAERPNRGVGRLGIGTQRVVRVDGHVGRHGSKDTPRPGENTQAGVHGCRGGSWGSFREGVRALEDPAPAAPAARPARPVQLGTVAPF